MNALSSARMLEVGVVDFNRQGLGMPPESLGRGGDWHGTPVHKAPESANGVQSDDVKVPVLCTAPGCVNVVRNVPPGCEAVAIEPVFASTPVVRASSDNTDSVVECRCTVR